MKMNRRQVLASGATIAAMASFGRIAAAQTGEVTIGFVYPMSGSNAQIGIDARHAYETAAELINGDYDLPIPGAKGAGLSGLNGAKVKLVFADHQSDPQKGRSEAERLITQDKVCAIIGSWQSSVAATVTVTTERYGIPYISADNSSPSLHRRNLKFFFRAGAHDEMFSKAMFDFMDSQKKAGKKIESVSLFHEDTIFGTDSSNVQKKLAEERGYKILADIRYRANSPSLTAEVQQLKSADADVLLPSSYTTDAILLVKTMAELGYAPKNIIAQAAGFSEQTVFETVGDKLKGMISRASFSLDLATKRPFITTVNEMFKKRSNRDFNDNTSRQFMALMILADAISRAKSIEGEKIREALTATDIPGEKTIMPWQSVKFGPDGQNDLADPVLLQYVGGTKFTTIFPASVAVTPAVWPMNG
jgi:branched-chain amino acid transport system substrate-binding protein